MQVFLKGLTCRNTILIADPTDTVEHLKYLLYDREGIPPSEVRLIFQSKELNDFATLEDCGVTKDATIHYTIRLKGGMEMYVKIHPQGKVLTFHPDPHDSVMRLKEMIQEAEGIPVEQQKLVWVGKVLPDNL